MARPQADPLRPLTVAERMTLERIARSSSERADRVARAKAVVAVADGQTYTVAAQSAGRRSGDGVAQLVGRFNRDGLPALDTAPRGRPPTRYGAPERERIL